MNINIIILMCLTYNILAANSMDSSKEAADGESSTSEVMLEWPKNLQPIKVPEKYWRKIVSHPKQMPTLKHALEDSKCPPDIVPPYLNRCTEDSWPVGIKTPIARAENISNFTQYKCRRIPGVNAAILFTFKNTHVPDVIKITPSGIIIFFNELYQLPEKIC